jgi:hypothetical protein
VCGGQSPHWLHDVIITWWLGYWCAKTGGLSNSSITSQRQRHQNKIDGQRKTFFATPFFRNYVLDGEVRGGNETKYVDIFTCSRMLIPVNIKLKHWILACIDFEQKWMAWLDSIGDTHEQETRLLFTWLTREHSLNRSTIFDPAEWSLHSGPPPGMQAPLQSNDFDCGIFICLYAAFLDIGLPLSFSQRDTRNVRTWMAHEMIERGKILKMGHSVIHVRGNSEKSSDNLMTSKRSSESQLQGDIKRQKTYELEASEEKKNIQAAAEFWAVMRATHGFQNQAAAANEVTPSTKAGTSSRQKAEASLKNHRNPQRRRESDNEYTEQTTTTTPLGDIDTLKDTTTSWPDTTANEVTPSTEPGTSSRQQAEASLASQGNLKRRRGSDDEYTEPTNHTLDTILEKPAKRKKESTGNYTKPNATATHHVDTQAGKPGDLMTPEVVRVAQCPHDPRRRTSCARIKASHFGLSCVLHIDGGSIAELAGRSWGRTQDRRRSPSTGVE